MKATHASWVVSDAFWERVEPLIPQRPIRLSKRKYARKPGGGRKPKASREVFEAIVYVLRRAASGRRYPTNTSAAPAQSTSGFWSGSKLASFRRSGGRGWPSMMRWKALLGDGKASTGHY